MPQEIWEEKKLIRNPGMPQADLDIAWLELLTKTPSVDKYQSDGLWHIKRYEGMYADQVTSEGSESVAKRVKHMKSNAANYEEVVGASRARIAMITKKNSDAMNANDAHSFSEGNIYVPDHEVAPCLDD